MKLFAGTRFQTPLAGADDGFRRQERICLLNFLNSESTESGQMLKNGISVTSLNTRFIFFAAGLQPWTAAKVPTALAMRIGGSALGNAEQPVRVGPKHFFILISNN
jgi:hypothetical protein